MSYLQYFVVWHVLWQVEFRSFNGSESLLDDAEHDFLDWWRPVDSTVEVPSSEVELLRNCVELVVVERFSRVSVLCPLALFDIQH